ncbi:alpha/beta hydrolase [Blastococcus sp. SYSU D00813]
MTSGLSSVAGWDARALGNAVTTLGDVGHRLVSWRARMESVGRTLGTTECWSGPAGQAAAASLVRVSTVVTEVTEALTGSLADADRAVAGVSTAAELAAEALAAAAAVPVDLDDRGRPGPLPQVPLDPWGDPAVAQARQLEAVADQARAAGRATDLAEEALRSADAAALATQEALAVLARVGVVGGVVPPDFLQLTARVGLAHEPGVQPPPVVPVEVAGWWAALSEEERRGWIEAEPALVGMLDGVPAWARDQANRLVLDRVVPGEPGSAVALAVSNEIRAQEAAGRTVQLLQFSPEQELVQLALGDLDTAGSVAVVVPGVGNDPVGELDDVAHDAAAVGAAAVAAAPGLAVATVAYFGYRPPVDLFVGALPGAAVAGAAGLDRSLDGIAAARAGDRPRVTVVAHSYGTVLTDHAADAPGDLAADAVVLSGSPGVHNDRAGFEVDEVYEASGGLDPVTWLEVHGGQTWDPDTGLDAVSLPTEADMTHGDYYDTDRPTLAAIGEVVAGTHDG